ncbi:MAG: M6 family metalloprotease domain-containing protein [Muribaculaceae bacterium]|nr:M6 family metalloprotease domain-containing protein [Muribaculaceae bacterium]
MKKIFSIFAAGMLAFAANAVPANPQPAIVSQSDGTKLTLKLCGDEFYHFNTTADGYTIVQNAAGSWVYAVRNGEELVASTVLAHDAGQRTAAEEALLATTQRRLTNKAQVADSKRARAKAQGPAYAPKFDLSKFHGLIILVEPSDTEFSMGANTVKFYEEIVNSKNLTQLSFGNYGTWTGSVRDYFYDNSMGKFDPHFDIYGPVTVTYKAQEFRNSSRSAFRDVLSKMNSTIDYSIYDGDGDGVVDNVCFVVAGYGSNVVGNPSGLLWPHESTGVGQSTYDGKRIDRYSCSTEMGGSYSFAQVDGIGTFCHEFTHVLGYPDMYDANYEENGQSHDPGDWDIMASGSYLNSSRTPAGYSMFERYALGFALPPRIAAEGTYTLNALGDSNEGFILRTPVNKEFFMIENRQKTSKWDRYLPGHGMIVARCDSTLALRWVTNSVNNYADHNYYELLRAGNTSSGSLASDPFPGTFGVPNSTNETQPSLRTWNGTANSYSILSIKENGGVITFNVIKAGSEKKAHETFNKIPISAESPFVGTGDIADWRLAMCAMETIEGSNRAVAMKNPSVLQMMTPVYYNIYQVTFDVNNTSSETAKLALLYSTDGGNKWVNAKTSTGLTSLSVLKTSSYVTYWTVELTNDKPVMFRITMTGGSKTAPCYIDNFSIFYEGEPGGPAFAKGDVNGDGKVDVEDVNAVINIILKSKTASDYDGEADVNGDGKIDVEDVNAIINLILKV